MKSKSNAQISTYVPQEIADAVAHLADKEGKSVSHWLRDIVRAKVTANEPWKATERRTV